jgi:hypothetical protein
MREVDFGGRGNVRYERVNEVFRLITHDRTIPNCNIDMIHIWIVAICVNQRFLTFVVVPLVEMA